MKPAKPYSTTMDEQTFVPPTMRALYHRPASTAITDLTALDAPRVDSGMIFDTDFPTPRPAGNQYLIKVQTAAFSHDELRLSRILNPAKSIPQIPLHNFCGTIISTPTEDHYTPSGPKFQVDDVVFGLISYTRDGAAADYVVATQDEIARKPKNISAAEAATIPLPALTAWQALFTYAGLTPGGSPDDNSSRRAPLRVLVTNGRDSEVGAQMLRLLRAEELFPAARRPWVCVTCSSSVHEEHLRSVGEIDELIEASLPLPQDFDLGRVFRERGWAPVDLVMDCAGRQMFDLAHSSDVVRDNGTVLTAVDDTAALSEVPRGDTGVAAAATAAAAHDQGIFSRFVAVRPDGEALARIARLVEEDVVRGRVEAIVDFVHGADTLSAGAAGAAGARRGGIMVLRVNV
ncbi:chaperonin 10-like protein [Aspergillus ambiguus]|uniref:NADP-dependent oxidoreductase n=1 Tax=Aspergillus ambiguus TaxID=176160 RepID=UPI003CCD4D4B